MFTFPAADRDQPQALLDFIGSFWSETFTDRNLTLALLDAVARSADQTVLDSTTLLDCIARHKTPVWTTRLLAPLRMAASQRDQTTYNLPHYDGSFNYEDSAVEQYGVPQPRGVAAYPKPAGLRRCLLLTNRLRDPSSSRVYGLDFVFAEDAVLFRSDPFDDGSAGIEEVFQDNEVVDQEAILWQHRSAWDERTFYLQWGYALGAELPATERTKDFLNALYDGITAGGSQGAVRRALAAACDTPVCRRTGEVVEAILEDARSWWIITDHNAYAAPLGSTVQVEVGDVLHSGDFLVNAVDFQELGAGTVPAGLPSLAMGRGFLGAGFYGDLVFLNQDLPLEVTTDADGYTRVSCALGGAPGDVEKFWDDVHERGRAAGQTLAHLLDVRTNRVGEPGPASLPATLNPLQFLCQNLLRFHLAVVVLQPGSFGPDALGAGALTALRMILPPHTALLFVVRLQSAPESITMSPVPVDGEAGYTETATALLAQSVAESIDAGASVGERVVLRNLTGRCL